MEINFPNFKVHLFRIDENMENQIRWEILIPIF